MASTIYSFGNMSGAIAYRTSSEQKTFTFGGTESIGINQIVISPATDNTTHDISIDGGIFVLPVLVWNGAITIECQQTSTFNDFLLGWYNSIKAQATATTPKFTNWANASMSIVKTSSSGTSTVKHTVTGISPQRLADKTYAARGGTVVWNLLAANIIDQ